MGRSCQAEQAIQDHFNALVQAQAQAQVGLLLGKQAVGSRDFILAAVPTPFREGQNPAQLSGSTAQASQSKAKKPGTQSSSAQSVVLDVEWIVQHASQLCRMLPGGVCILGVYLFSSDSGLLSAQTQLLGMLPELRTFLPPGASHELVVVHADSGTRKVSARSAAPAATALSVAELKWAPCLPNLMQVCCRWPLQLSLPSPSATASLQDLLDSLKATALDSIQSSVGLLSGSDLPNPDALLIDLPATSSTTSQAAALPALQVELLPLYEPSSPAGATQGGGEASSKQQGQGVAVCGQGSLKGWLSGVAVVHKRQKWSSALQELKHHLCASLTVRVELLVEDALSWQDEQQGGAGGKPGAAAAASHPLLRQDAGLAQPYIAALPHAVMLPLGPLPLHDYVMPGEGLGEVCTRAVELLSGTTGLDEAHLEQQMVWLESEGVTSTKLGAWNPSAPPARGLAVTPSAAGTPGAAGQCTITLLGGAAMGAAVAVAGLAYVFGGMQM